MMDFTFSHNVSLDEVVIEGKNVNLVGDAVSASEGLVGQNEINLRPISRTGEVLELVPGMVVTQHSGSGKANQYFLRGFNLDHATDFSTFVDGMPVNMRSHGHGQGYSDLNFIIPETIGKMNYKKGAYYADIGDFSGAGGVDINTTNILQHDLARVELGQYDHQRALIMSDFKLGAGITLLAAEGHRYDGPWTDIEEDIEKNNLLLKHTHPLKDGKISLSLMAYDNQWNSADQIPSRAVTQNLIDDLGSIDDTVGGESSRYSLSTMWELGSLKGSAYVIDYDLNLWSNFTYFLDDETNGDQFEQVDDRRIYGGHLEYGLQSSLFEIDMNNRIGTQIRVDEISEVGLYHTQNRERLGVTRSDEIDQTSISFYFENETFWTQNFRSVLGVRYDFLHFDVNNRVNGVNRFGVNLSDNGGKNDDDLISVKGSLIYHFNNRWEGYLSAGQGFHSNDARGTTIDVDPNDGSAVNQVDALVRSLGYEVGVRGFIGDRINTSISLWTLELDSELLFVGDAGNTEASDPSRRNGLEFVTYYYFTDYLSADIEYAITDSKFRNSDDIPGAVRDVLQTGLNLNLDNGWFGSLRLRYFGKRPLIEDGSQQSDSTRVINFRFGHQRPKWRAAIDILNLTDSNDNDIAYYYESRLSSEAAGASTEDVHYHPIEPRTIRAAFEYRF